MRTGWIFTLLSWIAAAISGGVFGIAGTIAHSLMWGPVPIGMILGAIACGSLLVAVRALTHDRWTTLAAGLGMIGMLTAISGRGPGGSVIVPDTVLGNVWVYLLAGLVLLTVAWPRLQRVPSRAEAPGPRRTDPDLAHAAPFLSSDTHRREDGQRHES